MLIGLLGRSRVGKDTAANAITVALGADAIRITRLSQPLKEAAKALYGFSHEQVEDAQKELIDPRYGVTPRVCIQKLCEHIMHLHGVDFFSKQLYRQYDLRHFGHHHVIIPDIRYEHDIREIRSRGGIIIKIERPLSATIPRHEWESHIDELRGDYNVTNDAGISELEIKINQILCNIGLA